MAAGKRDNRKTGCLEKRSQSILIKHFGKQEVLYISYYKTLLNGSKYLVTTENYHFFF